MSRIVRDGITVVTNNHRLPVLHAADLTTDEREEFPYIDWGAVERGERDVDFVRYLGALYDLGDTDGVLPDVFRALGWDDWVTDSFFSGVLFRYFDTDGHLLDGGDSVVVGRWWS